METASDQAGSNLANADLMKALGGVRPALAE
jgi:hypothetical protein